LSSAYSKKWPSCPAFVVIDGASHTAQTQCSGTVFTLAASLKAEVVIFEIFCHSRIKPTFMVTDHRSFVLLDKSIE
jgi:hypothetical protein